MFTPGERRPYPEPAEGWMTISLQLLFGGGLQGLRPRDPAAAEHA